MNADNPITELLAAPLSPDWTIEGLAEQLLSAIASKGSCEQEFTLVEEAITDRQSRRMIRPLLACLANMSADESGMSADIFGGHFSFKRQGPEGPVWILGQFENKPETVRVAFRRYIGTDDQTVPESSFLFKSGGLESGSARPPPLPEAGFVESTLDPSGRAVQVDPTIRPCCTTSKRKWVPGVNQTCT